MWESTLTCFTTGTFADIGCVIGQGFLNMLGNPVFVTIFVLFFGSFLAFKFKAPLPLTVIFLFSLVNALTFAYAPDWLKWVLLIVMSIGGGYGLFKLLRR